MERKVIFGWMIMVGVCLLFVDSTFAANVGMPWEGPMEKVVNSITGPVARAAGIVALTGTGITWAFGMGGDMVQKGAKVGTGLSIAFNAGSYLLPMLGFSGGMLL